LNGFLPPPYPIDQSNSGLNVPDFNNEISRMVFVPLLLRLATNIQSCSTTFKVIPYDYFCPSIKPQLMERCCKVCGLYHASIKSANHHVKIVHKKEKYTPIARKVLRPLRVAAKRGRELLIALRDADVYEWFDESDVEVESSAIKENVNKETESYPVINSISDWLTSP